MDQPPSYESAIGASSSTKPPRNGIPANHRRSMEDEARPLPPGWIRQYDQQSEHQFFVDTTATPPRSIWHHPYDDEQFLRTLSTEERERVTDHHRRPSLADIEAESSDDEAHTKPSASTSTAHAKIANPSSSSSAPGPSTSSSSSHSPPPQGFHKLTRNLKDKITQSTHTERATRRTQRAEAEQRAYAIHQHSRRALSEALRTGQPQFLFKDDQGRDVYIEPPEGPRAPPGAYGYNPYAGGPYADPNARFIRPSYPYSRPYGYGYGGGYGLPLMAGGLGGIALGSLFLGGF